MSGATHNRHVAAGSAGRAGAELAVAHLGELVPDVRGCAVIDAAGRVLAASGDAGRWEAAAADLLAAADAAAGEPWRLGSAPGGVLSRSRAKHATLPASLPGTDPRSPGGPATHVHVGTEEGEAFAVRHAGLAMVAVTERFALASLVLFDMRTILRDLASGGVVDRRAAGAGAAAGEGARAA